MKFYVVVNYYLVSLSFKFHEDPDSNARARIVTRALAIKRARTRLQVIRAHLCTADWFFVTWNTHNLKKY